jgi:hypothetical protein
MRNYILTFWVSNHCQIDDGMNPPQLFDIQAVGRTMEELEARSAELIQETKDQVFPPDVFSVLSATGPVKAYFLLDKANLFSMMNTIPGFFYDECMFDHATGDPLPPESQLLRCQLEDSPRKDGWEDSAGEHRDGEAE